MRFNRILLPTLLVCSLIAACNDTPRLADNPWGEFGLPDKTQVRLPVTQNHWPLPEKIGLISMTETAQLRASDGEETSVPIQLNDVVTFATNWKMYFGADQPEVARGRDGIDLEPAQDASYGALVSTLDTLYSQAASQAEAAPVNVTLGSKLAFFQLAIPKSRRIAGPVMVLKADQETPYSEIRNVLEELSRGGIRRVVLLTEPNDSLDRPAPPGGLLLPLPSLSQLPPRP